MDHPRRRFRRGLVVLVAATAAGACTTAGDPASTPAPTTASPSPTATSGHDVTYARAQGQDLQLDWYAPAGGGDPRPAVVLVHGGAWVAGDRTGLTDAARRAARQGYVGITIDYRLAPAARFPAPAEDVAAALQWVADHATELGVDADRIVLAGSSAGANLAALVATSDRAGVDHPRPVAVVAWSGVYDLRASAARVDRTAPQPWVGILRAYLGCAPDDADPTCRARYEAASPMAQVDAGDPPMLLLHGRDDWLPVADARALRDRRDAAGLTTRLQVYDTDAHGTALFPASAEDVRAFLDDVLGTG